jgi:hypothetical protein
MNQKRFSNLGIVFVLVILFATAGNFDPPRGENLQGFAGLDIHRPAILDDTDRFP